MIPNPVLLEPAAQPMPSASQHIKLPSLMIHENADEVERLKQRVHDLEIEVIRQDHFILLLIDYE